MSENRFMTEDTVKVEIFFEEKVVSVYEGTGFTVVDEAIAAAWQAFPDHKYSAWNTLIFT